jgi:TrmH family RNA methyltransferase
MGSIIRIADWFGIKTIVCSKDCVDSYHPKVIQSAMGSHLRVQLFSTDLKEFLSTTTMPIVSATLNGENLYQFKPIEAAILLIGNEGNGIQESLLKLATHKITIPRKGGAESLNAAMATGILCSHLLPH